MTNLKDIKIEPCSSSADLVAYLYDELNPAERTLFETHLADCGTCTDEFADLSFARLDVYEWHRDEFAAMETPHFVIPYAEAKASWVEIVRSFFVLHAKLATVGGAFAVLAFIFGGSLIFSTEKTDEVVQQIQTRNDNGNKSVIEKTANRSIGLPPKDQPLTSGADMNESAKTKDAVVRISASKRNPKPTNAVNRQSDLKQRILNKPVTPESSKAPRLNDFDDEDDNTLRLGDLLADIDTRK